jgi:PrtD family type I secretion system ABC transporter
MTAPPPGAAGDRAQDPTAGVVGVETSEAGIASSLRHLPESVAQRLDDFAAGSPAAHTVGTGGRLRSGPAGRAPGDGRRPGPAASGARSDAPVAIAQPDSAQSLRPGQSEIRAAILASKPAFIGIGLFSLVINVLMLAGPLFMLQVYDRVLTSGSMPTLVALSVLTALLYGMIGLFELIRTRVIARVGVEIDQRLSSRILKASLRRSLLKQGASVTALRELDNVRQFASGPAPMVFFDAPWTPIYLLVIFLVHWALGVAAALGAVLILVLALTSEKTSRQPLSESNKAAAVSLDMADSAQRNVEALAAMGMVEAFRKRWQKANGEALAWQIAASDTIGSTASLSKAVRLLLQSTMLGIGAALAINGLISAGSIIAGTIIFGRALAPVEQAVGQWRSFVKARESFGRLEQLLREEPEPPAKTALPAPKGYLEISQLRVAAPDTNRLILANLSFNVTPGQLLAVIGPSASGKSTLARTLVGIWPPFSGSIRIDGAQLSQWSQEDLGQHIGYLPQDVELFAGTVRDNICRFRDGASDAAVIEAAMMAHAHDMILALPKGYDTQLGSFGTYLSAGQRQRIGLARALFGHPALVVLDEPNANLDRLGDEALTSALAGMTKRGQSVIMISHRVQAIGLADTLLYLDRGVQRAFGSRADVMKLFQQGDGVQQPVQAQPSPAAARTLRSTRPAPGAVPDGPNADR